LQSNNCFATEPLAANICPETVKIPDAKRVGRR